MQNNTLRSPDARRSFLLLLLLRSCIAGALVSFVAQTVDLGTNRIALSIATVVGILAAGIFLARGRTFLRLAIWHVMLIAGLVLTLSIVDMMVGGDGTTSERDFLIYRTSLHIFLFTFFYLIGLVSTWYFWCSRRAVTVEAILGAVSFVWLLSTHRNYQLDAPKRISQIAWDYDIEPQHLILGISIAFATVLGIYLVLAHHRPLFSRANLLLNRGPMRKGVAFAVISALILLVVSSGYFINVYYSQDLSRASNGVGQQSKEGQSPLGFHSAVGKTKQPAALVRLETDFAQNPWQPMLYLREGALSEFNGRELVVGDERFDTDVPRVAPGQTFAGGPLSDDATRKEVTQSVYLLSKHNAMFAIDYPRAIRMIKNPDPQRFELAYQAVSVAPTTNLDSLIGEEVGDPSWTPEILEHYLRAPGSHSINDPTKFIPESINVEGSDPAPDPDGEDLRYAALAQKLAAEAVSPVSKAMALSGYLSEASIYTRNPGHQVTAQGDPVAPYLFSAEKRGYCVHFAHAAVFMMRLLGIPSRIATGYLTDLRYAKDGHILLHLGDRHAWPEIYVQGVGWVVVDVTPANAENEQVLVPDEKLLEELMSKIDPAEELVTPPPLENEEPEAAPGLLDQLGKRQVVLPVFITIFAIFLLLKLWIRYGYRLVRSPRRHYALAYGSFASTMADMGIWRNDGETRWEYARRMSEEYGVDPSGITKMFERGVYGGTVTSSPPSSETNSAVSRSLASARGQWAFTARRAIAFLSPLSLFRFNRW